MLDIKKAKVGDKVILKDSYGINMPCDTQCTITGFYQGLDVLIDITSSYGSSTVYPRRLHGIDNSINIKYSDGSY